MASNRRMLDSNGKVVITRYTACRDEAIRNLPEGVIDPWLRVLTFFNGSQAVARLSFYASIRRATIVLAEQILISLAWQETRSSNPAE